MNNLVLKNKIDKDLSDIYNRIISIFENELKFEGMMELYNSAIYHFETKGKMIRPGILMAMSYDLNLDVNITKTFGVSLELIHNYSLIHDDLPCMDDDDFRRGRLSVHKMFKESTAVLLGDYFLNKSIEYISDNLKDNIDVKHINIFNAINELYKNSGSYGMIGGQFMDLDNDFLSNDSAVLKMYELKTAGLFKSSFKIPGLLIGLENEKIDNLDTLASDYGILYQLLDDISDYEEDKSKITIFNYLNKNEVNELIESKIASINTITHNLGLNITYDYIKDIYEKKS